jgi:hypothetical protein
MTAELPSCSSCSYRPHHWHVMFEGVQQCVDIRCNVQFVDLCETCRRDKVYMYSWPSEHWDGETYRVSRYPYLYSDMKRMPNCMACDLFSHRFRTNLPVETECHACGAVHPWMFIHWSRRSEVQEGPREK